MTTKYTPKAWYVCENGHVREVSNDAVICTPSNGGHTNPDIIIFDEDRRAQHARLIASAPDMLDALEAINEWGDLTGIKQNYLERGFPAKVKAAIKAAKGET